MRNLQQLAQEALDIQDACNVCGLASGMHRSLCDLLAHARIRGLGTDWVNRNHITRLWIDKLACLAGVQGVEVHIQSYHWCQTLADGKNPEGVVADVADALVAEGQCR